MPVTLEKVRVFYRLGDAGLTPQSARVTIGPAVPVNAPAADLGITTRRVPLVLNVAGYLEAWVVRSNDPALSGPMPYRLVVDAPEHHRMSVIEIVGETDLADVAPVSEPVSVNPVYLLAAALGVTVAPLVDGLVPVVHLPPASGGASRYDHTQTTPAATWTVTHSLGRYPNATALDTAQKRFWPDLQYPDLNTAVVTHAEPLAGSLHLS